MSTRVAKMETSDHKQIILTAFSGGPVRGLCLQLSIWPGGGPNGDYCQMTIVQARWLKDFLEGWLAGREEGA